MPVEDAVTTATRPFILNSFIFFYVYLSYFTMTCISYLFNQLLTRNKKKVILARKRLFISKTSNLFSFCFDIFVFLRKKIIKFTIKLINYPDAETRIKSDYLIL